MSSLWQDVRYGLRTFANNPGITGAAILTLAITLGANTAVFSLVYGVLLRSLPYPNPERIFDVAVMRPPSDGQAGKAALLDSHTLEVWSKNARTVEYVAAYTRRSFTYGGQGEPERISGASVSASMFPLLRVSPALGRVFHPREEQPGAEKVTILSHQFWQRRFHGEEELIGEAVTLDEVPYTVVGVMPRRFYFPESETEIWTPLVRGQPDHQSQPVISVSYFPVLSRLQDDVSPEQAESEATLVMQRLNRQESGPIDGVTTDTVRLSPLRSEMVAEVRPALMAMFGAVGFVLLIASANLTNLLLARSAAREREMAIRVAMGAGKARLVRQVLTESSVLSFAGGLVGVLLAAWIHRLLPQFLPSDIPRLQEVRLDTVVSVFALALSGLTGLLFGLLPALRCAPTSVAARLHGGPVEGLRSGRFRSVLIVAEVALAVVLLIGAGLMLRSFLRLIEIDPGYEPRQVLTAIVDLESSRYGERDGNEALFDELLERLVRHPDVEAAGFVSSLPLTSGYSLMTLEIVGRPQLSALACPQLTSPGYLSAMRMRLAEGRWLSEHDHVPTAPVVVVNQSFARKYLSGVAVVGQRLRIEEVVLEVVGVVADVRLSGLDSEPRPTFYVSYRLSKEIFGSETGQLALAVRTAGDPLAVVPWVRTSVLEIDPSLPLDNIKTMQARLSASVAQPRFFALLSAIFAAMALVLASAGIYGVLSYCVSRRHREIGIRRALGAQQEHIRSMVLHKSLRLVSLGLAIGLVAAVGVTKALTHLLFGITAGDPVTYVAAPVLLGGVALVACYLPARRASRVDPVVALRHE